MPRSRSCNNHGSDIVACHSNALCFTVDFQTAMRTSVIVIRVIRADPTRRNDDRKYRGDVCVAFINNVRNNLYARKVIF